MVAAKIQIVLFPMAEKSGNVNNEPHADGSIPLAAWLVGTSTNCFVVSAPLPLRVIRFTAIPARTAVNEPDNTFVNFWAFMNDVSHKSKMARHTNVTTVAVAEA